VADVVLAYLSVKSFMNKYDVCICTFVIFSLNKRMVVGKMRCTDWWLISTSGLRWEQNFLFCGWWS